MGWLKKILNAIALFEEKMKLYEALAMKNSLRSQLTQLISIRNRSLEYPEDEQPEFDFDSLTSQIKEVVRKISALKVEIARANTNTILSNGKPLFENIIELANLRSVVDRIRDMMQVERRSFLGSERRSKGARRCDNKRTLRILLSMLQNYQRRKDALDSLVQQANHTIELPPI